MRLVPPPEFWTFNDIISVWSTLTVQTMENCGRFVHCLNIICEKLAELDANFATCVVRKNNGKISVFAQT